MRFFLVIVHLLVTLSMIAIILLQPGEEAGSKSMFGVRGAKSPLTLATGILGFLFFAGCITLSVLIRYDAVLEKKTSQSPTSPPVASPTAVKSLTNMAPAEKKNTGAAVSEKNTSTPIEERTAKPVTSPTTTIKKTPASQKKNAQESKKKPGVQKTSSQDKK